jgi:hypothetical protein
MKKSALSVLVVFFLVFSLSAQAPQPQAQQPKPEDIQKNIVLVEKPQTVPDRMKTGFEAITSKDSITLLTYLSSDLMEGRETATRGYQLAAEYAASLFQLWQLKPAGDQPSMGRMGMMMMMARGRGQAGAAPRERSYIQEFALKELTESTSEIGLEVKQGGLIRTQTFQPNVDYTGMFTGSDSFSAPVVFAGYGIVEKGIAWDEFKNLDVKGKIVLILSEAPGKDNPESPFQKNKELKEKYFPAAPAMFARRGGGGFNKTQEIAKLGAVAILQVRNTGKDSDMFNAMAGPRRINDERPIINEPRRRMMIPGASQRMPWESSPVINITREMANAVLEASGQTIDDLKQKIETASKPASMELPGTRLTVTTSAKAELIRSQNVLAYIEGSDPKLKDEVVVVGAHLDHLGKRGDYIFNGADDNGSGSVGVISLARAFAMNPERPKRTVVFALWTGEEEGLLGSRYYVMNPPFPIDKTIAYFNMDMISRPYDESTLPRMARMMNIPVDNELFKKIKVANFLPVSFSAGAGLAETIRNANQYVGLDLYLRESEGGMDRGMGGSDHESFAPVKIPWVFVITSMHEDYHQTSDSVEKVSGEMMEKISRLAYLTTFALADK